MSCVQYSILLKKKKQKPPPNTHTHSHKSSALPDEAISLKFEM